MCLAGQFTGWGCGSCNGAQAAAEQANERAKRLAAALAAVNTENQRLAKKRGVKDYAVPANPSELEKMFSGKSEKDAEIALLKKRAEELEKQLARQKDEHQQLEMRLDEEVAQKNAYIESNDMYEKRMQELEERMQISLEKEAERRKAAELNASAFKQRIKNLEFLLKELQDTGDDDDDDDSDDSDSDESSSSSDSDSDSDSDEEEGAADEGTKST